ncbi:MAG TPA: pantoate--beta-alanine ligase [Acetobacteraceae bacterium]|nr:pantoate--beta-alanine ligase [Acetobacteraceae bacterium]
MQTVRTLPELRAACTSLRAARGRLVLVPTMGALHDGHRALVETAAQRGAGVIASIFVNPLQFGPAEDLTRYPRDEAGDLTRLAEWGCALAWLPDLATMYPPQHATVIVPGGPAERWEGAARPEHFRGVATVVAMLFNQVRPDAACFGEKDWQQLQVVRRMTTDLCLDVEIIAVPTVRVPDGLALSSRNRYLGPAERATAPLLHAALARAGTELAAGEPAERVLGAARAALGASGFALDYLDLVDGPTLVPLAAPVLGARLIAAARLGAVRLIDNVPLPAPR